MIEGCWCFSRVAWPIHLPLRANKLVRDACAVAGCESRMGIPKMHH